jgi:hypothetical protein
MAADGYSGSSNQHTITFTSLSTQIDGDFVWEQIPP